MSYTKELYPRLNIGKIYSENEIIIGNIAQDSTEEPGMIKWDGEHLSVYTGTNGWINLDDLVEFGKKELSENPTYYLDNSVKIMKYEYTYLLGTYYEERYEYTNSLLSKIEIKDDKDDTWIQKTNLYDGNDNLIKPTITTITSWSIT